MVLFVVFRNKEYSYVICQEFFKQVDYNRDGKVTYDEFLLFWQIAHNNGYTENIIIEEVLLFLYI